MIHYKEFTELLLQCYNVIDKRTGLFSEQTSKTSLLRSDSQNVCLANTHSNSIWSTSSINANSDQQNTP